MKARDLWAGHAPDLLQGPCRSSWCSPQQRLCLRGHPAGRTHIGKIVVSNDQSSEMVYGVWFLNIYRKRQGKGRKTRENILMSRFFDNTDDMGPCWVLNSKLLVAWVFLPELCSVQGALPHLLAWQEREQQQHNSINTLLKRLLIKIFKK